jgi:MFS family permease
LNPTVKRLSVLMTTAFVDMIGFGMVFPLLPYYARRLDAADWMIGPLIAIFSIAQLGAAPLWGRLSDRFGRRLVILVGLSAAGIAFIVFAFSTTFWWLFVSRLVQGIGGGTTGVLQAYVADVSAPKDRARALGWLSASTSAGVMVGPAIGSLAFTEPAAGIALPTIGTALPGLLAAVLVVVNILFAIRWLPESKPQADPSKERRSIRLTVREYLVHPFGDIARLVWIYAVGMLGFMSMTAVLALYLQDGFGVDEKTIGIFFVYVGAVSLVMRALILGPLVDRFGETRVMRAGAVLLAVGLAGIPLPTNVFALGAIVGLVPIGTSLLFPSETALVIHRAADEERGQILGVQQAFGAVSRIIAPVWATAAYQGIGQDIPFYVAGAIVGLVTLLAFRVREEPRRAPELA